jgi:hypothetical protein
LGDGWGGQQLTIVDRHNSDKTKFSVWYGLDGVRYCQSTTNVIDGNIYHIQVSFGDGFLYLFINGTLESKVAFTNKNVNSQGVINFVVQQE